MFKKRNTATSAQVANAKNDLVSSSMSKKQLLKRIQKIEQENEILRRKDLEQQQIIKVLEKHALIDILTGLHNRRYIEMRGSQLENIGGRRTSDKWLCILLIDINLLKLINDMYGHSTGDRLLREFSQFLLNKVGEKNIVSRIGGDEFVVIHICDSEEESCEFAFVMRRLLNDGMRFVVNDKSFMCTSAVGFACTHMKKGSFSFQELLREADTDMYKNKSAMNCRDK